MAEGEGVLCPRGHRSVDTDYCSECGARLAGSVESAPEGLEGSGPGALGVHCPDCGTAREQPSISFCEVCGFNFATGAHGEIGIMPPQTEALAAPSTPEEPVEESEAQVTAVSEAPASDLSATPHLWRVHIAMDPSLRGPDSPEAPAEVQAFTVDLTGGNYLLGRSDVSRGIAPEIAVDFDEAVSRRHALLQPAENGVGWMVRDIGAANGTRLNGKTLVPMQDYALASGDEITLGHWTRVRVEAA